MEAKATPVHNPGLFPLHGRGCSLSVTALGDAGAPDSIFEVSTRNTPLGMETS